MNQTIANLMKYGRKEEIVAYFQAMAKENSTETFCSFMDQVIMEAGLKRAVIAQRSGLSKDYVYKLLRGDKRTTERDYIIAICLAIKLDLLKTQHALELYPFPVLDSSDPRSAIIIAAINERIDMDTLNEWLEKVHFPLIKISPDMVSAKVGPVRSTIIRTPVINSTSDEETTSSLIRRFVKMEKINTIVTAEHAGLAPMDYFYAAELELQDDAGNTVFAQAGFWPWGEVLFCVDKTSMYKEECLTQSEKLESFESLEDASASAYFPYYLELDRLTDAKTVETMAQVNDTKFYGGFRLGAKWENGMMFYAELYNSEQPQLNEYLQVKATETGYLFSASHKSRYMKIELGEIYDAYFAQEDDLCLFEVTSLDELGEYCRYRYPFTKMVEIIAEEKGKLENKGDGDHD